MRIVLVVRTVYDVPRGRFCDAGVIAQNGSLTRTIRSRRGTRDLGICKPIALISRLRAAASSEYVVCTRLLSIAYTVARLDWGLLLLFSILQTL